MASSCIIVASNVNSRSKLLNVRQWIHSCAVMAHLKVQWVREGDALIVWSLFCWSHCSPTLTDRQRGFTIWTGRRTTRELIQWYVMEETVMHKHKSYYIWENQEQRERDSRPTGALLWPGTETEVEPWHPGVLGATDTWTGLQAWEGGSKRR